MRNQTKLSATKINFQGSLCEVTRPNGLRNVERRQKKKKEKMKDKVDRKISKLLANVEHREDMSL